MNSLSFKALAWCICCAGVCSASSITTCSVVRWVAPSQDETGVYEVAQSSSGLTGCSASYSTTLDPPFGTLSSVAYAEINGLLPELDEYGSNMVAGEEDDEQFVSAYASGITNGQRTLDELGLPGSNLYAHPLATASFDFFGKRYVINNPRARRGGFERPWLQCGAEGYGTASCGVVGLRWGIEDISGPMILQQSGSGGVTGGHGDGGEARLMLVLHKPTIWDADGNIIPESEWEIQDAGDPVVTEPNTVTLIPAGLAVLLAYRRLKRISS